MVPFDELNALMPRSTGIGRSGQKHKRRRVTIVTSDAASDDREPSITPAGFVPFPRYTIRPEMHHLCTYEGPLPPTVAGMKATELRASVMWLLPSSRLPTRPTSRLLTRQRKAVQQLMQVLESTTCSRGIHGQRKCMSAAWSLIYPYQQSLHYVVLSGISHMNLEFSFASLLGLWPNCLRL